MMIPVAVNNLYGDPLIQWEGTKAKVRALQQDPYAGPVALITKGFFTEKRVQELLEIKPQHLVVFVSISSLSAGSEQVSVKSRLFTIRRLRDAKIPVIGYARPLLAASGSLIKGMYDHGANAVVVSGFRGTPEMGSAVGCTLPSIRVKEMSAQGRSELEGYPVFHRTSCGAAFVLGMKRSWNPYWKAPTLAGCQTCPLKSSCFDIPPPEPSKKGLKVLQALGYQIDKVETDGVKLCSVRAENRKLCPSCCTTCYIHLSAGDHLLTRADGKRPNLGDLSFARHIAGVAVYHPGVIDGGDPSVGDVNPPNPIGPFLGKRVRALNTWISYSNQIEKCFGCSYCFAPYYNNELGEYGATPSEFMGIAK